MQTICLEYTSRAETPGIFALRSGTGKSENVFKIHSGVRESRGMGCKELKRNLDDILKIHKVGRNFRA